MDDLVGDEVGHPQEHAGDDDEADDHPSGLHHLPTVRPLYSLKLAPASLEEVDQPRGDVLAGRMGGRRGGQLLAVAVASATASPRSPPASAAATAHGLLGEFVFRDLLGELRTSHRQLGLGQLHVRRPVLDRVGRLVESITQLQTFQTQLEATRVANATALEEIKYNIATLEHTASRYDPLLKAGAMDAKTVEQTRRLVEQEQVAFLFNSLGTACCASVRQYMNDNKIPQLFVATGAFGLRGRNR